MVCFQDDLDALLAIHRVPVRHRIRVRTTNLCERSFVEERRRTKVIPRFKDEKVAMKLVFATLIRAAGRWCRVSISDLERHQVKLLRAELGLNPPPSIDKGLRPHQSGSSMITRPPIYRPLAATGAPARTGTVPSAYPPVPQVRQPLPRAGDAALLSVPAPSLLLTGNSNEDLLTSWEPCCTRLDDWRGSMRRKRRES